MNSTLALTCVVTFSCLLCRGQTNIGCPTRLTFCLPPVQLSTQPRPEVAKPEERVATPPAAPTPAELTAVDLVFGDAEPRSRVVRSDVFYLNRPWPRSDSFLVRTVEDIFMPEPFYVGKMPVSCTIFTAIKRKNPLCLLNPIFFQASW
jgi:hypothetical protein